MPNVFSTLSVSRFVDREAVLALAGDAARELCRRHPEVVRVELFGSFATGRPTPRSDIDLLITVRAAAATAAGAKVTDVPLHFRSAIYIAGFAGFPLPVELFVVTEEEAAAATSGPVVAARSGQVLAEGGPVAAPQE